jgi:hypothetical protein
VPAETLSPCLRGARATVYREPGRIAGRPANDGLGAGDQEVLADGMDSLDMGHPRAGAAEDGSHLVLFHSPADPQGNARSSASAGSSENPTPPN